MTSKEVLKQRAKACGEELEELLEKYNCMIVFDVADGLASIIPKEIHEENMKLEMLNDMPKPSRMN